MSTFLYIITASILESLIALVGILFIFAGYERFKKYLPNLISFAVGTFLAVVFFELLPETLEGLESKIASIYILSGFLFFFVFSRFLHWYHHHDGCCENHNNRKVSGHLVLVGDFIHNFIDGIIISLAFIADVNIGIITTIAVLFHEFPQEVSDFFILLHSGFSKKKALILNFLVSFSTIVGAILTYFLVNKIEFLIAPAIGIVAGNFLYISASDLIPELNHKKEDTLKQLFFIILGIVIIFILGLFISE
jgi:zinc and cadmium transporter